MWHWPDHIKDDIKDIKVVPDVFDARVQIPIGFVLVALLDGVMVAAVTHHAPTAGAIEVIALAGTTVWFILGVVGIIAILRDMRDGGDWRRGRGDRPTPSPPPDDHGAPPPEAQEREPVSV